MADNDQFQADDCRCTMKLYTDMLMRCVYSLEARLSREQRDLSDVARTQSVDGRNNDGRRSRGIANVDKKLDDLQEILDAVSELTRCCSNGNSSYSIINYLRTRKMLIIKNVKDVINATRKSQFMGTTAGTARTTTVETKRGRADEERGAAKRRKTRHDDNRKSSSSSSARTHVRGSDTDQKANRSRRRNAETARTTSDEKAKRERDAAERRKSPRTQRDGGERTRWTITATDENVNRSTVARTETSDFERKSQFSVVVVNELNPYYKRGVFATVELFRFMARTIVHRLMDSTVRPDEHVVRSTIRQLMPERRITSEYEILALINPFYK